jgi:hypothetical protein
MEVGPGEHLGNRPPLGGEPPPPAAQPFYEGLLPFVGLYRFLCFLFHGSIVQ